MRRPRQLDPGTQLGRWQVRDRLGRGAVATVYLAEDPSTREQAALKVLHLNLDEAETHATERLRREVEVLRRIDHPGVCRALELFEDGESLYLAVEYIPGFSLQDILDEERRLPVQRAVRVVRSVCDAVEAMHGQEILHRDLKPGNVMVRPDGQPVVLDFGYAIAPGVERVTRAGVWVGTLAYAAPEMLKSKPASERSDVYALAVLLYQCITGELPFRGVTYGEIASAVLYQAPEPLATHISGVAPGLEEALLGALQRDPAERYASAAAFSEALAAYDKTAAERIVPPTKDSAGPGDEPTDSAWDALREEPTARTLVGPRDEPTARVLVEPREEPTERFTIEAREEPTARFLLDAREEPTARTLVEPRDEPTARTLVPPHEEPTDRALVSPREEPTDRALVPPREEPTDRALVPPREEPTDRTAPQSRQESTDPQAVPAVAAPAENATPQPMDVEVTQHNVSAPRIVPPAAPAPAPAQPMAPERSAPAPMDAEVAHHNAPAPRVDLAARPAIGQGRTWEVTLPEAPTPPEAVAEAATVSEVAAAPAAVRPMPAASTLTRPAEEFLAMRKQLAELSAALIKERNAKGIIAGDVSALDVLEKSAEAELGRANWAATIDALQRAVEAARGLTVDRAFVTAKIARYDAALTDKPAGRASPRCQEALQKAQAAFDADDVAGANAVLNKGFERLRSL